MGPISELMPQRPTIWRAIPVSCWMSDSAPVVGSPSLQGLVGSGGGKSLAVTGVLAALAARGARPDGWVSLEVSPLLAHDTTSTIAAAKELFARAARPNLFIKIPGTQEGLPAIEEAIFAGVPVNVTLLFSREQYVVAAEAYLRGIERRIAAGINPQVGSVASMFISRWDASVTGRIPEALNNRLGIAMMYIRGGTIIGSRTYPLTWELEDDDGQVRDRFTQIGAPELVVERGKEQWRGLTADAGHA